MRAWSTKVATTRALKSTGGAWQLSSDQAHDVDGNINREHLVEQQPWEACKPRAEEEAAQAHHGQEDVEVLRHVSREVCQDAFLDSATLLGLGAEITLEAFQYDP